MALVCLSALGLCVAEAQAGTRWRGPSVSVRVEPSLRAIVPNADEVVARAAERWSSIEGAPALEVTTPTTEGGLGYHPRGSFNSVSFAPEGSSLVGGALAVTLLTYDADTLELLDADVIFNGKHRLLDASSCEPDEGDPAYDFESVLQHELGHVLGLEEDFEHSEAVMYPYASPWSTNSRSLKAADESALATLYATPLPDELAGCSARIAAGGAPISGSTWFFAVGWVCVALGRRRRDERSGWAWPAAALSLIMITAQGAAASDAALTPHTLAYLEVLRSSARWEGGVLYTNVELATRDCAPTICGNLPNRLTFIGGSRDGVVQVLGHEPVPHVGAFLEVVAPPPRDGNRFKPRQIRTVIRTKGGDSLWIQ